MRVRPERRGVAGNPTTTICSSGSGTGVRVGGSAPGGNRESRGGYLTARRQAVHSTTQHGGGGGGVHSYISLLSPSIPRFFRTQVQEFSLLLRTQQCAKTAGARHSFLLE